MPKEFKGYFKRLGENTEKYITFSVPIKNEHGNGKTATYKLKFIDSYRFMQDSLSNLVDNLSGIDNKEQENKFIDNMRSMMTSLSLSMDKISEIDKKIMQIEKLSSIYQLCNQDHNKFALLLRKRVYPYEYTDSWKRFKEKSLPDKESFYSELNKENITDENYAHGQEVWKVFKIKDLGEYHDLYVQSDALLLADVFENFRDKCIEKYELDPDHFLSAPGLAWQACLKKTGVKLELLTDPDMLLTFEDGTRGGMYNAIYRYAKANNKYMKNYNKNVESSFIEYLDANNLYGWAMSKKLPVGEFEWINPEDYTEDIIKKYDENDDYGAILEVDVDYPKHLHKLHSDLPFLPERMKINKVDKLICNLQNKRNYVVHTALLKQALDHGLILKKVHRVIKFKQ